MTAVTAPAHADTPGISTSVLVNGSGISEGQVIRGGDTLRINVQHENAEVQPGSTLFIGFNADADLDPGTLERAEGNDAIANVEEVEGGIEITWADPMPSYQQGVYQVDFEFNDIEHSEPTQIEWIIGDETYTWNVTTLKPGDEQENVSNWLNKGVGWANLNQYVSVEDGQVVLAEGITDHTINYTLNVNTDRDSDRSSFTIADEISEYLAYNDDFSAEITTWDENGLNRETNTFDFEPNVEGNSFSGEVDIPSPSQLEITYSASVSEDQLENLRGALQVAYDDLPGEYGNYNISLGNTVDFNGETTDEGNVNIGGSVDEPAPAPGPNPGQAFNKSGDAGNQDIVLDEDENLVDPIDVTYTFTADLSQWDGRDEHENPEEWTLGRNVVISDQLPAAGHWNTEAEGFITASGIDLTLAEGFDGDAAAFAADEYEGFYAVVGQNLYINIGQDQETNVEINALVQVTSIEGLWPWEGNFGAIHYAFENNAEFYYSDGNPYRDTHRFDLIDRGDTSGGIQDPDSFSKNASGEDLVYVEPGESVTVDYEFVVNGVDVTSSYIVDHRDPAIFDLSDLDEIQANISGQYNWWRELTSEHFNVSANDDGNLVIQLSESGIDQINAWDHGVDARLAIDIPLTTYPLEAQQTITIENSATLYGQDDDALYWSETVSQGSSYGDQAEVRKSIRDTPNEDWTQNLQVEVDEDGNILQEEFVYNLAFIPHGNYSGLTIIPVIDELPEEVEFIGFVTDENVDTGDNPQAGPIDIGGNLEAVYDETERTVTVQSQAGQLLVQEPNISANVLVRLADDFNLETAVFNIFGGSEATITPPGAYPLSIAKVDTADSDVVIDDPNSRFNILAEDQETVVVEDAFVEDGVLRVLNEEGVSTGLVVSEPGTYYVQETVAPEGYELSEDLIQLTVNEDGSSQQTTFPNVPVDETPDPTYAVGDYVWVDSNADGLQGEDEDPLEGVTVVLFDGEGNELDRTTTDADGRYLFDELPAGEYQVQFILTEEQAELYEFTDYTVGEDSEVDSNAGENGYSAVFTLGPDNEFLTSGEDYPYNDVVAGEGIDPTWDAGAVLLPEPEEPEVSIIKGDGEDGVIENDANTEEDAVSYEDGETREIVIEVENTGTEVLVDVELTDVTQSGTQIEDLVWTTPDGLEIPAELDQDTGELFAFWAGPWAPGEVITGVAGLTLEAGEELHTNLASVSAVGLASGTTVEDDDPYNATPPEPEPVEPTYAIGDYVWIDSNNDGVQDEDEDPLAGVNVVLFDGEGNELDRTTTDADGRYIFDELPAGEYQVRFVLTEEQAELYEFTEYTVGEDSTADSNAGEDGYSEVFTLGPDNEFLISDEDYEFNTVNASEGIDPTWDAGVVLLPEPEEPEVSIIKGDGTDGEIVNDANTEEEAEQYEANETREILIEVENTGTEVLVDVDLTDVTQSGTQIENLVWTTPDGVGIPAELDEETGDLVAFWAGPWAPGEVITGAAELTLEAGEELHTNLASVNAVGLGSGITVEDDDPYNATPPQPEPEEPTYAVGDYVWVDSNADGLQGEDEDPLEGVTVVLYDGEGNQVATTTTDENGRYLFDQLPAGEYQVRFVLTEEQAELYEFTDYTVGEDSELDSNAGENGYSAVFTLGPDNEFLTSDEDYEFNTVNASEGIDPTWDAGVVLLPEPEDPTYAIGDYVWIDENGNGIQDDGETPLEGVEVVLYDDEGNELDRTTTNEDGRYLFDNLPEGDYQIQFILTEEQAELYEFTDYTSGDDPRWDSNAGDQGFTTLISLGPDSPLTAADEYGHQTVTASEGIDPTWDAGVVLIPEEEPAPTPSEEPTSSEEPTPSEEPTETPAPSEDPTPSADPTEDPTPSEEPTETPDPTEAPTPSESPEPTESPELTTPVEDQDEDDAPLATTGASIAGIAVLALLLLTGGIALMVRNRRKAELQS